MGPIKDNVERPSNREMVNIHVQHPIWVNSHHIKYIEPFYTEPSSSKINHTNKEKL